MATCDVGRVKGERAAGGGAREEKGEGDAAGRGRAIVLGVLGGEMVAAVGVLLAVLMMEEKARGAAIGAWVAGQVGAVYGVWTGIEWVKRAYVGGLVAAAVGLASAPLWRPETFWVVAALPLSAVCAGGGAVLALSPSVERFLRRQRARVEEDAEDVGELAEVLELEELEEETDPERCARCLRRVPGYRVRCPHCGALCV